MDPGEVGQRYDPDITRMRMYLPARLQLAITEPMIRQDVLHVRYVAHNIKLLRAGRLPLSRMTRVQTMDPGEAGQRLVQSARGPTRQRGTLSRTARRHQDPPLLLVIDAGDFSWCKGLSPATSAPLDSNLLTAMEPDILHSTEF